MADWLEDLIAAARAGGPVACAVCGTPTPTGDLQEACLPSRVVRVDGITEPFDFTLSSPAWVCPKCSAFARPADRPGPGEVMPPT